MKFKYVLTTFFLLLIGTTAIAQDSLYTLKMKFTGHTANVEAVAWSDDGKLLASGGWDNDVHVYKADTPFFGKEIFVLKGHVGGINSIEFSKDNKFLATASKDFSVRIYSMETGMLVYSNSESKEAVTKSLMDPKAKFILSSSLDGNIRMNEILNNKTKTKTIKYGLPINCFAISLDGRSLYLASSSSEIDNIDFTGKSKRKLQGHSSRVNCLALSPNGKMLASGSDDKSIIIWDLATGKTIKTLLGHTWKITSVSWSQDGKYLVSTCNDGISTVWDVESGESKANMNKMGNNARAAVWAPDMSKIAVATLMDTKNCGILIYNAPFKKWKEDALKAAGKAKADAANAKKTVVTKAADAKTTKNTTNTPKK